MGTNRVKYRLRSTESQTSVNTDTFINVQLQGTERLLPTGEINEVVDSGVVFNNERQSTTKYRIIGTVKPIMSNVLFNYEGAHSWLTFDGDEFKDDPYSNEDIGTTGLTFPQSYTEHLKEKDGWFGYYDPNFVSAGACDFVTMEPQKRRFSMERDVLNNNLKNWELTVTYPWSADTTHFLVRGTTAGLKIVGMDSVNIGGRWVIVFSTPVKHNLNTGDRVRIEGLLLPAFDGDYRVIRTGLDDGTNMEYYFSVNIGYHPGSLIIQPVNSGLEVTFDTRMKRLVAGQESTYYLRLFKKITTVNANINNGIIENDDYEIYPTAFAKTIYRDEVSQFVVNEDIEVKDLTDNLDRPLSEIYITFIKTKGGYFTDIKSGLECGMVEGVSSDGYWDSDMPDIRAIHNDVGQITGTPPPTAPQQNPFESPLPLEANVSVNADYFYGDLVEYNRFECLEYVLSEVGHRFNTESRENISVYVPPYPAGPRLEGYFYLPHHRIKIRDFSNYVEQGDENTFGIPGYAEDLGDGRWLWRDLLDIGINDGQYTTLNYPFLNGAHYLYQNLCLPLRRQDPFGRYGLYYGDKGNDGGNPPINFTSPPFDIVGRGTANQYTVNLSEDVC